MLILIIQAVTENQSGFKPEFSFVYSQFGGMKDFPLAQSKEIFNPSE